MEPVRDVELYRGLEQVLGAQVATALMDRLPPAPVDRLVTTDDLSAGLGGLRQEMSAEFALVRQEMSAEFALVRQEMTGLRQETTAEFAAVRQEMSAEFALVRQEMTGLRQETTAEFAAVRQEMTGTKHELIAVMRGEMIAAIHTQGRQLAFTLAGSLVGLSGLAFLIANLAR